MTLETKLHCVKSARVWSFCGSYFPAFGMNTDQKNSEYGHFSRSDHFLREQLKLKDDHFRDEISYLRKQLEECLHLSSLKRDDHDFVSYREILNLLLKMSITTTVEPPRDSNSINSINIHKSSAVNSTNDDRC